MAFEALEFVLFSLAVFRLTHLIVYDTITEFIRGKFLNYEDEADEEGNIETVIVIKGEGWKKWMGELISCHWCMGIWCSLFLLMGYLFFYEVFSYVIYLLAAAGVAAILGSIVVRFFNE